MFKYLYEHGISTSANSMWNMICTALDNTKHVCQFYRG